MAGIDPHRPDAPRVWTVIDHTHVAHHFEEEGAALRHAHLAAFTDRPTVVRNPGGTEWLVMLRDPRIEYLAVRKL